MNRLLFEWRNYRKVTFIKPEYTLFTKSGGKILEINESIKPIKPLFHKESNWHFSDEIEKMNYYKVLFNKKAKELLKEYRNKKQIKLTKGTMVSGDYIVKCKWCIYINSEYAVWKEFKKYNTV